MFIDGFKNNTKDLIEAIHYFKFLPEDDLFVNGQSLIKNYGTSSNLLVTDKFSYIEKSVANPDLALSGTPTKQGKYVVTVTTPGSQAVAQVTIKRGVNTATSAQGIASPIVYEGITFTFPVGTYVAGTYTFYTCNSFRCSTNNTDVIDATSYTLDNVKGFSVNSLYSALGSSINRTLNCLRFPSSTIDYNGSFTALFRFQEVGFIKGFSNAEEVWTNDYFDDSKRQFDYLKSYPYYLCLGPLTNNTYKFSIQRISETQISINGTIVNFPVHLAPVSLLIKAESGDIGKVSVYVDGKLVAIVNKNAGTVNTTFDSIIYANDLVNYAIIGDACNSVFQDFAIFNRSITTEEENYIRGLYSEDTKEPLILFTGQSNAVGQITNSLLTEDKKQVSNYFKIFSDDANISYNYADSALPRLKTGKGWTDGFDFSSVIGAFGPELGALNELTKSQKYTNYYIIKSAANGQSIPNFLNETQPSRLIWSPILYALAQLKKHLSLKAVIYIQGEAENTNAGCIPYKWRLNLLLKKFLSFKNTDKNLTFIHPLMQDTCLDTNGYHLIHKNKPVVFVENEKQMYDLRGLQNYTKVVCKQNNNVFIYDSGSVATAQDVLLPTFTLDGTGVTVNIADTTGITTGYKYICDSVYGSVLCFITAVVPNVSFTIRKDNGQPGGPPLGTVFTSSILNISRFYNVVSARDGGRFILLPVHTVNESIKFMSNNSNNSYIKVNYLSFTNELGLNTSDYNHYQHETSYLFGTMIGKILSNNI